MQWDYRSATIRLTDDKMFGVWYGDEEGNTYESYEQAVRSVDDKERREERDKRVKVSIPILCRNGDQITKHTLIGIHAGHGGYIMKPALKKHGNYLYLDHPAVSALLYDLQKAEETVAMLKEKGVPFCLPFYPWERTEQNLYTHIGLQEWFEKVESEAEKLATSQSLDE